MNKASGKWQRRPHTLPDFRGIATKHADLRDDWFQDALLEAPGIRPPALVPDELPNEPLTLGVRD